MTSPDEPLLFRRVPARLPRRRLRAMAEALRVEAAGGRPFLCLLTGDRELRRLNRRFLGVDRPTDVLSFPESAPNGSLGEIAISVERARAQARQFGHRIEDEIAILMLHGVLHLKGLDHKTGDRRMARVEKRLRKKLGLPLGLIERV